VAGKLFAAFKVGMMTEIMAAIIADFSSHNCSYFVPKNL
jgi:hypothetical protein